MLYLLHFRAGVAAFETFPYQANQKELNDAYPE
jgi:hypothetical protein